MTFSEYSLTRDFRKLIAEKRRIKKKNLAEIVLIVALILGTATLFLLIKLSSPAQKNSTWFRVLAVVLSVIFFAVYLTDFIIFIRNHRAEDNRNYYFGFVLFMREQEIDWSKFFDNGVLAPTFYLPDIASIKTFSTRSVRVGSGDDAPILDFSPWGELDLFQVVSCISAGVIPWLEENAQPTLTAARIQIKTAETAMRPEEAVSKPIFWIKQGKWTFDGKWNKFLIHRAQKKIRKQEEKGI